MQSPETPRPMKPYLIHAVLDYCRDNGATPYLMVAVDSYCQVPMEYVRDGRIVFDLSDEAIHRLAIDDSTLSFQARFGEQNEIFTVEVPLNRIIAVTPLEYQQFALHFEVTETPAQPKEDTSKPAERSSSVRRPMRIK